MDLSKLKLPNMIKYTFLSKFKILLAIFTLYFMSCHKLRVVSILMIGDSHSKP